jgi:hypothetical protein
MDEAERFTAKRDAEVREELADVHDDQTDGHTAARIIHSVEGTRGRACG